MSRTFKDSKNGHKTRFRGRALALRKPKKAICANCHRKYNVVDKASSFCSDACESEYGSQIHGVLVRSQKGLFVDSKA